MDRIRRQGTVWASAMHGQVSSCSCHVHAERHRVDITCEVDGL